MKKVITCLAGIILLTLLSGCNGKFLTIEATLKVGLNYSGSGLDVVEAEYKMDLLNDSTFDPRMLSSGDAQQGGRERHRRDREEVREEDSGDTQ